VRPLQSAFRVRGDLFIVSSPSGAGKTTLIRHVIEDPRIGAGTIHFSVSHTTRAPRAGEVDGHEYYFVTPSEFQALVDADGFLEHAVVHGQMYGTSRGEVEPRLASGVDVILDIDVQGARQVRSKVPEVVKVFVFPPSRAVLEERLKARGSEGAASVALRLSAAVREMKEFGEYDYAIINEDLPVAVDELRSVIVARRTGRHRQRERLEAILRSFSP
jgi:guanylate kinase